MSIRNVLEDTVMGSAAVLILLLIWMVFLQPILHGPPISFKIMSGDITHQTVKQVYRPGEYVTARVDSYKKVEDIGFVDWNLINNKEELIEAFHERISGFQEKGANKKVVPVERLPANLLPGTYQFHGYLKYDMGYKVYLVHVNTNWFKVE